jgi:hypothetical protein
MERWPSRLAHPVSGAELLQAGMAAHQWTRTPLADGPHARALRPRPYGLWPGLEFIELFGEHRALAEQFQRHGRAKLCGLVIVHQPRCTRGNT